MRNDSNYIFYHDMVSLVNKLHSEYPELISLETIGETFEKRGILMMTMTLN